MTSNIPPYSMNSSVHNTYPTFSHNAMHCRAAHRVSCEKFPQWSCGSGEMVPHKKKLLEVAGGVFDNVHKKDVP